MKKILSLILALALCAGLSAPVLAAEFTDVPAGHYAHDAIQTAAAKGIASGFSDGSFRPDAPVTHAQFALMLARAFFPEDLARFQAQGETKGKPWHWAALMTLRDGYNRKMIVYDPDTPLWERTANTPIPRGTMADMLYELLLYRGIKISSEETKAALDKLKDGKNNFHIATVCSLGIVTGYPDGTFGYQRTMNRAQACVVIDRTAKIIGYAADRPTTVEVTKNPTTYPPGDTLDGVSTDGWICWRVADNNYPTGTLNNGKPITEENVLAMLKEAEAIWPTGLHWGGDVNGYDPDNSYYDYGKVYSFAAHAIELTGSPGSSSRLACGGFAAMLSDYIFGKQNNLPRKLKDNAQVRPGDTVIFLNPDNSVAHVSTALTTVGITNNGNPGIKTADGNMNGSSGGEVWWDTTTRNYPSRIDNYPRAAGMATCVIYTRYPE